MRSSYNCLAYFYTSGEQLLCLAKSEFATTGMLMADELGCIMMKIIIKGNHAKMAKMQSVDWKVIHLKLSFILFHAELKLCE